VHHITNPATEENLFTCEFAGEKEVNIAVSAALEAQKVSCEIAFIFFYLLDFFLK
jgi:acyl-CoA reductase-like NAD-dependent aldehyde dehydrogenase